MSTIDELIAQRAALAAQQAEIEKALSAIRAQERAETLSKIEALMVEHGLTVADLGAESKARSKAAGSEVRKPVAAKFRNNATGETWSGRGLKPKWLSAAIEGGAKVEDFLIEAVV